MTKGRPFSIYCIILFLCTEARKNNHILLQRGMYLSQKWSTAPFLPAGTQGSEALRVMRIVWHRRTCIKNLQSSHRRCPIWEPATHSHNGERNESACSSHFAGNCKKRKNSAANGKLAAGKWKTFWKQQEKVENSTEKLQNGAAEAGKLTPSRPTKKPNRLKMVGHLYKTHLENRSSTSLVLCDTTKTRACDIFYVTGSWCARRDSNPRHLASESADGITFAADGKATVTVEQFELNL